MLLESVPKNIWAKRLNRKFYLNLIIRGGIYMEMEFTIKYKGKDISLYGTMFTGMPREECIELFEGEKNAFDFLFERYMQERERGLIYADSGIGSVCAMAVRNILIGTCDQEIINRALPAGVTVFYQGLENNPNMTYDQLVELATRYLVKSGNVLRFTS